METIKQLYLFSIENVAISCGRYYTIYYYLPPTTTVYGEFACWLWEGRGAGTRSKNRIVNCALNTNLTLFYNINNFVRYLVFTSFPYILYT